jgi:hypothetical protein
MRFRLAKLFIYSAGILLLITGAAKIITGFGGANVLALPDPIFKIQFRYVFWIVGSIEIVIAYICFLGKSQRLKIGIIAWLTTCFIFYRIGLHLVYYSKPCSCLGMMTEALGIQPELAASILKAILCYLLIGSYGSLLFTFKSNRLILEK